MTTFDALNKLGNLMAVGFLEHPAMKPAFSLTAWNDRMEHQVCYLVIDHISSVVFERFYWGANKANIDYLMEDHDWLCCLAYVTAAQPLEQQWDHIVRLDPSDYAALVAAARGEA